MAERDHPPIRVSKATHLLIRDLAVDCGLTMGEVVKHAVNEFAKDWHQAGPITQAERDRLVLQARRKRAYRARAKRRKT